MTSLHMAAETGRSKIMEFFVDSDADINARDKDGVSISLAGTFPASGEEFCLLNIWEYLEKFKNLFHKGLSML